MIANVTEIVATTLEVGQIGLGEHKLIRLIDCWLSIRWRGGTITTIRAVIHEAGIDDDACAKLQRPSGGDPIG